MATAIEYALMAGVSYRSNRDTKNRFPIPSGWNEIPGSYRNLSGSSGFEAASFTNGGEIVISFAGTDFSKGMWSIFGSDFWNGNIPLITGASINGADQLVDAVEYYLEVKATAPANATITLTGHSLGGALASLVGVFFGETAFTFDQVPAAATAAAGPANLLYNALLARGHSAAELAGLNNYIQQQQISGGIPNAGLVTNYNIQGEVAGYVPGASRIGNDATIDCEQSGVSASELHSVALLTTFLQSNQTADSNRALSDVTYKLTDLLKMVFDENLFARTTNPTNTTEENLLERLVKHEAGIHDANGAVILASDAMVTRFTSDLWKLAQEGGLTLSDQNSTNPDLHELSKALIAFAMQYYYEDTANAVDAQRELFATDGIGNGLRFDLFDVAETFQGQFDAKGEVKLGDAKGYQYFLDYLKQDALFSAEERGLIQYMLPYLRDWTVQAGTGGLTATDTRNRGAFLLGGADADTLTGGERADLLVGNAGDDTLTGSQGNDVLLGGAGHDTYVYATGDGLDTVLDRDGQGSIQIDGQTAVGGKQFGDERVYRDDSGNLYVKLDGNRLALAGKLIIENWQAGQLGIALEGPAAAPPPPQTTLTLQGDQAPADTDPGEAGMQYDVDELGNLIVEGAAAGRRDLLLDSPGNDHIQGLGGDDILTAYRGGHDWIEGGDGHDAIRGDGGDDLIEGGADADVLSGGAGNDRLYADTRIDPAHAIENGNTQTGTGQKADWLAGGDGDDLLIGSAGHDVLSGGGGSDLLIGGAGDDYLLGDTDYLPASTESVYFAETGWTVTPYGWDWTVTPQANGTYTFQTSADGAGDNVAGQADVIYAGNGNDIAWGGAGDDILFGEGGADQLIGAEGHDTLLGGNGDDKLWGNAGADWLDGGAGNDELTGGTAGDLLVGNAGSDTLDGGNGSDVLLGGQGHDTLRGGAGADQLLGGADNDSLDGGQGNDLLQGGAGNDTYAFSGEFGTDVVIDSDGGGTLKLDEQTLAGGAQQKLKDIYQDEASGATYIKLDGGKTLVILKEGEADRILVREWQAGRLGIALSGDVPAAPAVTLAGDFKKQIDDHGTADTGDDTYVMTTEGRPAVRALPKKPGKKLGAGGTASNSAWRVAA